MCPVIDRRLAGKNKSIGNRERFIRRHHEQLREAVKKAVGERGIENIGEKGEDVHIPRKDISEPVFGHGQGGIRDMVHPGNKEYVQGDRIERPKGGGGKGSGAGKAGDTGEGEDDFVFHLTKEEFMQIFFDDLALPNLARTTLTDTPEYKMQRAGYTNDGTPSNLHLVRSSRNKIARRRALSVKARKELEEILARLIDLNAFADANELERDTVKAEIKELEARREVLTRRIARISGFDPMDMRYRARIKVPVPIAKAVVFCLMDVSGSMNEERKDLAKRFYILLYLFLTRHYAKIDLVFIRHHTQAEEVNEHDFFHKKETGGTVVSSALVLMDQIIKARYPTNEWNIYGAQASDGDNWNDDSGKCVGLLVNNILPLCRYYAYVQVVEAEQNLWDEYAKLARKAEFKKFFAMRKVAKPADIYPVFRELFKKEQTTS